MNNPRRPPLSVWPTGQHDSLTQLRDTGCVPGTETDAYRVPPAVAAHAIAIYTRPGDLVLDPDCGAGTVLNEALRSARHTVGLTAHNGWWALARANITAAKTVGSSHDGAVLNAPPNALTTARAAGLIGRVGLVLTALRTRPDRDRLEAAIAQLAATFRHCEPLLGRGGHLVAVARPRRYPDGSLVDLPTPVIEAGIAAGLVPVERCVALTAGLRGSRLVTRASLAERRAAAGPIALTAHHEVLIFRQTRDTELAAEAAAGIPWLSDGKAIQPAADRVEHTGGRRAA